MGDDLMNQMASKEKNPQIFNPTNICKELNPPKFLLNNSEQNELLVSYSFYFWKKGLHSNSQTYIVDLGQNLHTFISGRGKWLLCMQFNKRATITAISVDNTLYFVATTKFHIFFHFPSHGLILLFEKLYSGAIAS
jgi:hypothetical protein